MNIPSGATMHQGHVEMDEVDPITTLMKSSRLTTCDGIFCTNDSALEQDDEECVNIERRFNSSLLKQECKTPEYPPQSAANNEQDGTKSSSTTAATSRSIKNPPLLRPKHPSLTHSHQPWNDPTDDQDHDDHSSRWTAQNAPPFPHSPPNLTSTSATTLWRNGAITASNASFASFNERTQCDRNIITTNVSKENRRPSLTRPTSLSRRVLLSFQDCHFVRLPPRVSRADGYLHDITWRVESTNTSPSRNSGPSETHATITSPDRKRIKATPTCWNQEMSQFATPVKGYTIASVPTSTLFIQNDDDEDVNDTAVSNVPPIDNHQGMDVDRLTFYRDKYYHDSDVVYTSSLTYPFQQRDDSSREPTPLPLLDFDDDSESMSSENGSSSGGCCDRYSDSPINDISTSNNKESSLSSIAVTSTTTNDGASRTMPKMKPPKLKMRTNHPLLLQQQPFTLF